MHPLQLCLSALLLACVLHEVVMLLVAIGQELGA
jgi:hypothetical protein